MNATADRMNLAWRTVNAIHGHIHATSDRMNATPSHMNATADRMNLTWRTVNAIHGHIHATGDRMNATPSRMNAFSTILPFPI